MQNERVVPSNEPRNKVARWTAVILVGCIFALFGWNMIDCSAHSRPMARRAACAANLKAIATSCLVYAEAHQGQFPPSLDLLLEGGSRAYLQPKQLICPESKRLYIYIPSQTNTMDPRNIVVYETAGDHQREGRNVAYADGHAQWTSNDDFAVRLRETRERLLATSRPSWQTESVLVP